MNKILITGGAGFIGSNLVLKLVDQGCAVTVLDNLSPQIHGENFEFSPLYKSIRDKVRFVYGSVLSRKDWMNALFGVDAVVHLAAETGTGQSMYQVARYNEVNSQGTAILFDILANSTDVSVKRIVLASSRSIYGEGAYICPACGDHVGRVFPDSRQLDQLASHQWDPQCKRCRSGLTAVPTHEDDRIRPASIYAATKFAQEDLVRVGCEALGIGYAILRLQNVYGEGQSLKNPYTGILSIFSTRVRRGLQLTVFEDGLESRDFVHVSDVAQAMLLSLTTAKDPNTVINVGSGVATSVIDVAANLSNALGKPPDIRVTAEYRLGDIRHNVAEITRLREILNYTPQVNLRDGLRRFCDWVLTQPLPDDLLDRANAELKARKLMG